MDATRSSTVPPIDGAARACEAHPATPSPLAFVPHAAPLVPGVLVDRYDRFIAEVRLDEGRAVRAHCVNPGRMEGLVRPGARVWLLPAPPNAKRKLRWTWELAEDQEVIGPRAGAPAIVGANTVVPNRLVAALLAARTWPGFRRYRGVRSEVRYGERSRVDFVVDRAAGPHYLEVKNCHLVYPDGRAYFPDSVSVRAAGHLAELAALAREGARASVVFTVQRPEPIRAVRPSMLHDPAFAEAAREAGAAGVRFRAVQVVPNLAGYAITRELAVDLRAYDPAPLARFRDARLPESGWRADPRRAAQAPSSP
ncbi:MAG: DNA/RNA nuclease SfsA [Myxococcota bacterium]